MAGSSLTNTSNTIRTSVLIIGGGAAGMSAALHLHTSKAIILEMPGSNSVLSPWNIMIKPAAELKRQMQEAGGGMNDQMLLQRFISGYPGLIPDMKKYGLKFRQSNIGLVPDYRLAGIEAKRILDRNIKERGITHISGQAINFLLDSAGLIRGVKFKSMPRPGSSAEKPAISTIIFDYLVLAGGGISSFFPFATGERKYNGNLLALCYECGFALRDMEFMMFHPFLITDPRFPRILFSGEILAKMEFYNNHANRFLSPDVEIALRTNHHHHIFPQMIREFHQASLRGKIFAALDCSQNWFNQFKKENEFGYIFSHLKLSEIGQIEIHPAFHFSLGGININDKAQSSQSHVYAAGEITGGLYGCNRIGGTAIAEAWIFGRAAAEDINKKTRKHTQTESDTTRLRTAGRLGISAGTKNMIWKALGPIKDSRALNELIRSIERKKSAGSEEKLIRDIARICIARKESIGTFYRPDKPGAIKAKNSYLTRGRIVFK